MSSGSDTAGENGASIGTQDCWSSLPRILDEASVGAPLRHLSGCPSPTGAGTLDYTWRLLGVLMEGAILLGLAREAKILGLSTLALGAVWLVTAIGASQSLTALGLWRPDTTVMLECGRQINTHDESSRVISAIRAKVVLDDAWAELDSEPRAVRSLVVKAAGLLRGTGLSVIPIEIKRWNPPESLSSPREILDAAKTTHPPADADIVIVLTAGSTTRQDGAADIGGRHVVIRHHRDAPENDVVVLAHELGHLLGAHHGCDSDAGGGIMGATGFANAELLCPCTRRAIERNISRFHEST